ncbi:hypothetical protein CIG75_15570 [Tumebacillus algifaecis]|uniref:NlpC/P60 domain-containing protein n=1 Tax=Tumebacillus algifaecis TaxID=1214604 RepID=A0A223D3J6_9BACL|nr:C40 family peptidase [Tumebacillus algifaecis]ASS76219.1 hypothetical protein CIG75_15570 [Tumebacillus algifaecis]
MKKWKKSLMVGLFSSMLFEQQAVAVSVGLQRADVALSHRFGLPGPLALSRAIQPDSAAFTAMQNREQKQGRRIVQPLLLDSEADWTAGVASRLILDELEIVRLPTRADSEQGQPLHLLVASRSGMNLPIAPVSRPQLEAEQTSAAPDQQQHPQGQRAVSNPAPTLLRDSGATAPLGSQAVSVAMQYRGVPYQYGGTTPSGFDCSGFIQFIYQQVGVELPRTTHGQLSAGVQIAQSSLQPGDLIFFACGGIASSHAGIYVGNGQFIHADADRGIMVAPLDHSYWAGVYQMAVRIRTR